jgi:hypothetical protein
VLVGGSSSSSDDDDDITTATTATTSTVSANGCPAGLKRAAVASAGWASHNSCTNATASRTTTDVIDSGTSKVCIAAISDTNTTNTTSNVTDSGASKSYYCNE